ncbi:MAG: dUTP diphosphatase [Spirochaetales bacterium]|jgi:dUTP pyrophosphatase|nr:dUTP diphosphatase [Spirochaetales bacterium]
METLEIPCLCDGAALPLYASQSAAGADLKSSADITIQPGEYALVPTGIRLAIPQGMEAQVRPRSGLALKHGVTVLNAPGTIDADYRGEIKVLLINHGKKPFSISAGDRIAQIVFAKVYTARLFCTDVLPESVRGTGGFGSTG